MQMTLHSNSNLSWAFFKFFFLHAALGLKLLGRAILWYFSFGSYGVVLEAVLVGVRTQQLVQTVAFLPAVTGDGKTMNAVVVTVRLVLNRSENQVYSLWCARMLKGGMLSGSCGIH